MTLPRLFVVGDSISIQYGPYLERYLQGHFTYDRKRGTEPALVGLQPEHDINGRDSAHVLAYLQAMQRQGGIAADVLLLNCGLHDIKTDPQTGDKQITAPEYEANLTIILQLVREMGLKLIWVRTTPVVDDIHNRTESSFHRYAADVELYNGIADALMQGVGVPVIDLYAFTRSLGEGVYCDHVHYEEHVRAQQGAYIAGWLEAWALSNL